MNTPAPLSVEEAEQRVLGWQAKLHRWAEEDSERRFGDLFNLLCEPATLLVAWERVKRNRGSQTAGVDGQTRTRVEELGVQRVLSELRGSLRDRSYAPLPARERAIPKRGSGKVRKLGIPALRDRIVQMAAKLVLEPILETDFCPISYGFRPGRRTQDAIEHVRRFINAPSLYEWVIEGDVEDCFGSIHHGLLMAELRRRVTDKRVLRLVRQFLAAGVMREHGSLAATPSGAPQGAILSPLLANVALSVLDRHFEAAWNAHSSQERSRRRARGHPSYRMVRYADDFMVLVHGTRAQAEAIKETAATLLRDQLRLTLSPEKTRITHVDDGFDFLVSHRAAPAAGSSLRRVQLPEQIGGQPAQTSHQDADRAVHDEPVARRAPSRAQPRIAGLDQLLPPCREQTLLRLPRPLPVDAAGAVAAQEAPAADLETGPATVLGTQLDEHRGHQALLAHDGGGDPLHTAPPTPTVGSAEDRRAIARLGLTSAQCA